MRNWKIINLIWLTALWGLFNSGCNKGSSNNDTDTGLDSGSDAEFDTGEDSSGTSREVLNFRATPVYQGIRLDWQNPDYFDFAGVRVVRKTEGYPSSPHDGTEVYFGTVQEHSDEGLDNGIRYYYKIFTYDGLLNYSDGVEVSAKPLPLPAPADTNGFKAIPGNEKIKLIWQNPADPYFSGVKIVRKNGSYPVNADDGLPVYDGEDSVFVNTALLNGTTYYYSAFTYNEEHRYSGGVKAQATPPLNTEFIDISHYFEMISPRAIAVDKNNITYIAYGGNNLFLAHYNGGRWHIDTVDSSTDVGESASIAIDPETDQIHIVYSDNKNNTIKYASQVSGSWIFSTIGAIGDFNRDFSIALDSSHIPHVSYADTTDGLKLKYAIFNGNEWELTPLDSDGAGYFNSIAIDHLGQIFISYAQYGYLTGYHLQYAWYNNTAWSHEPLDTAGTEACRYTSIAVDSFDQVHVIYQDYLAKQLKWGFYNKTDWRFEVVDSTGSDGFNSLAIDETNSLHVSYLNGVDNTLRYALNNGTSWLYEVIDTFEEMDFTNGLNAIATDHINTSHVAYYDYASQALKYAQKMSDGSWQKDPAPVDVSRLVGFGSSIAVDSHHRIHVSYFDNTDRAIKYARHNGTAWQTYFVDTKLGNGMFRKTSIAVDSNDKPHISYYDTEAGYLKYAWFNGSGWVAEDIDYGADVGLYQAIAIDSNNVIHIVYYYEGAEVDQLKHAHYNGTRWSYEFIGPQTSPCYDIALAIDANDKLHLGFGVKNDSPSQYELHYATNQFGTWVTSAAIDAPLEPDATLSIAIDSGNKVHISYNYYDEDSDEEWLKYATNKSGAWTASRIDSGSHQGLNNSLALDSQGHVFISYSDSCWDEYSDALKYATNAGGDWTIFTISSDGIHEPDNAMTIDKNDQIHISYYDVRARGLVYTSFVY